ncbi:MAG: carbohydrate kinase [Clostridia bacterium]
MKKFDIVSLGEILIDYTPREKSQSGMAVFEQNPGGAPANVMVSATKLGLKTAFIGKIGQDMQGDFLRKTLDDQNIETKGLISDPNYFTTLAFVSIDENGERNFAFARKPGADTMLRADEVNLEIVENAKVFHFGSLSLTDEIAREATFFAVKKAKEAGAIISYDPNYRAPLWNSKEQAIEQMKSPLELVDILKISDEETELMTGEIDPYRACEVLLSIGIPVVAITLGADGALIATKDGVSHVKGFKPQRICDTNGAGDSFWGGFLYKVIVNGNKPCEITIEEAVENAFFANGVASLCVENFGAIPAMPTIETVNERLATLV